MHIYRQSLEELVSRVGELKVLIRVLEARGTWKTEGDKLSIKKARIIMRSYKKEIKSRIVQLPLPFNEE